MPHKHSDFKHEIQNSRCSKLNKNNENPKKEIGFLFLFYFIFFENDYVLLNIFAMTIYTKNSTF